MIEAMNAAEPAVFAIMDYWTFDGWFALKRRLAEPGAPALKKIVFPGIELRTLRPDDQASQRTRHLRRDDPRPPSARVFV